MKDKRKNIDVDEEEVIKLMRRDYERRLGELAARYNEGPLETDNEGKVSDTLLSPGLKLALKNDVGSWDKGSLWVVTDPHRHPSGRKVSCTPEQVLLVHYGDRGETEDMIVLKSELDDKFELR